MLCNISCYSEGRKRKEFYSKGLDKRPRSIVTTTFKYPGGDKPDREQLGRLFSVFGRVGRSYTISTAVKCPKRK